MQPDDYMFAFLEDVNVDGIVHGQVPTWDANASVFVPGPGGGGCGGGGSGNLWAMSKTSSQNLPGGGATIEFERADVDGGGGVVDLPDNRFVAPAAGMYVCFVTWAWESAGPQSGAHMAVAVNGVVGAAPLSRTIANASGYGTLTGTFPLLLSAGDLLTVTVVPLVNSTARGNASPHLSTWASLLRVT